MIISNTADRRKFFNQHPGCITRNWVLTTNATRRREAAAYRWQSWAGLPRQLLQRAGEKALELTASMLQRQQQCQDRA